MSVSRRQALQIGGVGVIGALGLAVPLTSVDAKSASQLDARNMPKPYQRTLPIPPVLAPKSTTVGPTAKRLTCTRSSRPDAWETSFQG